MELLLFPIKIMSVMKQGMSLLNNNVAAAIFPGLRIMVKKVCVIQSQCFHINVSSFALALRSKRLHF